MSEVFFYPEDGGTIFIQNVGNYLLDYMVSCPRKHITFNKNSSPQFKSYHNMVYVIVNGQHLKLVCSNICFTKDNFVSWEFLPCAVELNAEKLPLHLKVTLQCGTRIECNLAVFERAKYN
jgi:hypothetical protein